MADKGYGDPLWRALELQRRVLHRLRRDVAALEHADPRLEPSLGVFTTIVDNALAALDELEHAARELDDDASIRYAGSIVERSGHNEIAESYLELPPGEHADELKKRNGSGQEAVSTAAKVFDLLGDLPVIGVIFAVVAKILDIVSQFLEAEASATEAERQIEEKLHQLGDRVGRVITGEPIPVGPGTVYVPEKPPVKVELEDIEKGLAFIMDLPQGREVPDPPGASSGVQPVSLTDIKNYLKFIADVPRGSDFPAPPEGGGSTTVGRDEVTPVSLTDIRNFLAYIADVPQGSDVPAPPSADSGVTPVSLTDIAILIRLLIEGLAYAIDLPAGLPFPPRPAAGQPVSLTDLERKLDFIMDFEPGEGRQIPPVPPGVSPVSLTMISGTMKKIYVAREGTFAAAAAGDSETIEVRAQPAPPTVNLTPAFDLSGWLDLSELRDGDAFSVRIDAQFAGRPPVRFAQTTFNDAQPSPLKHWRDFAGGVEQVVGTSVDVTLAQRQSADGFATPVTIGYQFVVESP